MNWDGIQNRTFSGPNRMPRRPAADRVFPAFTVYGGIVGYGALLAYMHGSGALAICWVSAMMATPWLLAKIIGCK